MADARANSGGLGALTGSRSRGCLPLRLTPAEPLGGSSMSRSFLVGGESRVGARFDGDETERACSNPTK